MSQDLALLQPDDVGIMEVKDPRTDEVLLDGEKKPVTITLHGIDSDVYQREQHAAATRRLNKTLGRGRRVKLDSEELERDALELLIKSTKAWSGIVIDGATVECTQENVRSAYTRFPWLREQVAEFIADRANFLGKSSTT